MRRAGRDTAVSSSKGSIGENGRRPPAAARMMVTAQMRKGEASAGLKFGMPRNARIVRRSAHASREPFSRFLTGAARPRIVAQKRATAHLAAGRDHSLAYART